MSTFPDRLYHMAGVPVGSDEHYRGGNTWYVRDVGDDDATGNKITEPLLTISKAVSLANDWDTIIVLPNKTYTTVGTGRFLVEADTPITIDQRGLRLLGTNTSGRSWGNPMVRNTSGAGGDQLFRINADDVEIAYLGFYPNKASSTGIAFSFANATYGSHIHDCYFKGGGAASYAVTMGDATYDCVSLQIERCYFQEFATACVKWYAGMGATLKDCIFRVTNSTYGVDLWQAAGGKGYFYFLHNLFLSGGTGAYAIYPTATPSDYYGLVDDNRCVGFADEAHCGAIFANTNVAGMNYHNATLMTLA